FVVDARLLAESESSRVIKNPLGPDARAERPEILVVRNGERVGQVEALGPAAHANLLGRVEDLFAYSSETRHELHRGRRNPPAPARPLLVDDRVNLPRLRVHPDDRARVLAERPDG